MTRDDIEKLITRGSSAQAVAETLNKAKVGHESSKLAEIISSKLKVDFFGGPEKQKEFDTPSFGKMSLA